MFTSRTRLIRNNRDSLARLFVPVNSYTIFFSQPSVSPLTEAERDISRPQGCPYTTWISCVKKQLKTMNYPWLTQNNLLSKEQIGNVLSKITRNQDAHLCARKLLVYLFNYTINFHMKRINNNNNTPNKTKSVAIVEDVVTIYRKSYLCVYLK